MREKGISWKKCIGNNQYFDDNFEKWIAFVAKVLLDAVCALIFVSSARIMLADIYYWAEFDSYFMVELFFIAVLMSATMEYSFVTKKKWGIILQWEVLLIGALYFVHSIVYGENAEFIVSGMNKMVSFYAEDWNSYYETTWLYTMGRLVYVVDALNYITMVLFFVAFWMAKMLKQNLIMVVLPAIVLILELLVGYSPEYKGLMQLFVAVLISNTSKWEKPDFCQAPGRKYVNIGSIRFFSWAAVGIGVFLICGIIKLTGTSMAEDLIWYSSDMKAFYKEMVEKIEESSIWEAFNGESDSKKAELTNDAPKFEEIEVMNIQLWEKPENNLYLKNFYAGNYNDGKWTIDLTEFEKACEDAGYDAEAMSININTLGVEKVYKEQNVNSLNSSLIGVYATINYKQNNSKKASLPYFVELNDERVSLEGDARYKKDKDLFELTFLMWQHETDYRSNMILAKEGETAEWEKWYIEYVKDKYLTVPDDLPTVKKIADELEKKIENEGTYYYWENNLRMAKADLVAQWMEDNTRYSLSLPKLPSGTDPIEYFLGKSKVGYCMHFASASVMILREMGVPARYAAGYLVKNSEIEGIAVSCYASVMDSDAHAWVEIYLENIGWVPIEVTKGYSEYVSETEKPTTVKPTPQPTTSHSSQQPTSKDESTSETTTKEKETSSKEKQTTSTVSGEKNTGIGKDENQIGEGVRINYKKVFLVVGGLVVLTIVVFCVIRYKETYRERLLNVIRREKTTRAINMINRRIYKKLRHTGKIFRFNVSDEEYKNVLIENYPEVQSEDWELYMDIVKAAAFSKREFTVEEMDFCYGLYCKVVGE